MIEIGYRFDPRHPAAHPHPADATEARRVLERGNREFASLLDPHDPERPRVIAWDPADLGWAPEPGMAPAQTPFAAVLGCADARVPVELVFHQGANDLFVVRVVGHVLGAECLGSLRYALHHFAASIRLVVVLGHAECGAVAAAVDAYLALRAYLPLATNYPLRTVVDQLLIGVRGAGLALETAYGSAVTGHPGFRRALAEVAVAVNAAWTAFSLAQELHHAATGGTPGPAEVAWGVYDLVTRQVGLALAPPGETGAREASSAGFAPGLVPPPADAGAFLDLGRPLAASARVGALLTGRS